MFVPKIFDLGISELCNLSSFSDPALARACPGHGMAVINGAIFTGQKRTRCHACSQEDQRKRAGLHSFGHAHLSVPVHPLELFFYILNKQNQQLDFAILRLPACDTQTHRPTHLALGSELTLRSAGCGEDFAVQGMCRAWAEFASTTFDTSPRCSGFD